MTFFIGVLADRQVVLQAKNAGVQSEHHATTLHALFPPEVKNTFKSLEVVYGDKKFVSNTEPPGNTEFIYSLPAAITSHSSASAQFICRNQHDELVWKSDTFELNFKDALCVTEELIEELDPLPIQQALENSFHAISEAERALEETALLENRLNSAVFTVNTLPPDSNGNVNIVIDGELPSFIGTNAITDCAITEKKLSAELQELIINRKHITKSFLLLMENWNKGAVSSQNTFWYEYVIEDSDVSSEDLLICLPSDENADSIIASCIRPYVQTGAGTFILYANQIPKKDIGITYMIHKI